MIKHTQINADQQLSEHFALREFITSTTAIRRNIDNTPSDVIIERLRQLCTHVLEPLRQRFGMLRITSGYRSPKLNRAVGGATNSQHLRGEAADIHVTSSDVTRKIIDYLAQNLDFDQAILEHNRRTGARWLHLSYTTERPNRHQLLNLTV